MTPVFNRQTLTILIFVVMVIALPFLFPGRFAITLLCQTGVGIIFALSYNLLLGGTGLMSFGHAAYYGIGGFACLHLLRWMETDLSQLPVVILPLFGGLAGFGLAALFGLIAARHGATVFAMITLGFGEVMLLWGHQSDRLFGGEGGIDADRMQGPVLMGLDFAQKIDVYWLIMFWLFLCIAMVWQLHRSPTGLLMAAHRDNAARLPALGLDPARIRYRAFCMAGFLAGIAGALFALIFEIISAEIFTLQESAHILLMASLGGPAPILGPILGGVIVTMIRSLVGLWSESWPVYLALLMIILLYRAPDGFSGLWQQWRQQPPRLCTLVRGSMMTGSGVLMIEMLYRLRLTAPENPVLDLYILILNANSFLPWSICLLVFALAAWPGLFHLILRKR